MNIAFYTASSSMYVCIDCSYENEFFRRSCITLLYHHLIEIRRVNASKTVTYFRYKLVSVRQKISITRLAQFALLLINTMCAYS